MVNPLTIIKSWLFPPSATAAELATVKPFVEQSIKDDTWSIWSKSYCPYCTKAKSLLQEKGQGSRMKVFELDHRDDGRTIQAYLAERLGKDRVTVPQIFFKGQHIGGCSDLEQLERSGKLQEILNA